MFGKTIIYFMTKDRLKHDPINNNNNNNKKSPLPTIIENRPKKKWKIMNISVLKMMIVMGNTTQ